MLWFALACFFAIMGFVLEKAMKGKSNKLINWIVYLFTFNGTTIKENNDKRYNVKKFSATYSILSNGNYELRRNYTLISYDTDIKEIEEGFNWTTQADSKTITPIVKDQTIDKSKIKRYEGYERYPIEFNNTYIKKQEIETGSLVKLHSNESPEPFLAYTITRKTKILTLDVHFSAGCLPLDKVLFKAYNSRRKEKVVGELCPDGSGNFHVTVEFPRIGWRYVISWEKIALAYLTKE